MARAGIASRRKAEEMILSGRVLVNRQVVLELGTRADPAVDRIEVDGELISLKGPLVYFLINKPKGCISALYDPQQRPLVIDLLKRIKQRVFPVGRLDYDSEGVLLLTNDGELSNKLMHPRYRVEKRYLVKVSDVPDAKDLKKLEQGVFLSDGRTRPAKVRFVRSTKENSWIEIIVTEGRNRLIRRMCERVGHSVAKLKRTEFAGIGLGGLKSGEFRALTSEEIKHLKSIPLSTEKKPRKPAPRYKKK
jgi:pseudouridine synthase